MNGKIVQLLKLGNDDILTHVMTCFICISRAGSYWVSISYILLFKCIIIVVRMEDFMRHVSKHVVEAEVWPEKIKLITF